jgi:hypothetical protein
MKTISPKQQVSSLDVDISASFETRNSTAPLLGGAPGNSTISGQIRNRPWTLTCGQSTRDFIVGSELFARAKLDLPRTVSILVINRALKDKLEKIAFRTYTRSVQTLLDVDLPQEMYWLATHQEAGWDGMPWVFWGRFAVLASDARDPRKWVTNELAEQLIAWIGSANFLNIDTPFMLTLMRGRVEMRMQIEEADEVRKTHAVNAFTTACTAALDNFLPDIEI